MRALSAGFCFLTLTSCGTLGDLFEEPDPRHEQIADLPDRMAVEEVWSDDIGDGGDPDIRLRSLYVGRTLYIADADGRVVAFDPRDGAEQWRSDLDAPVSFALGGGARLLTLGTADGQVIALAARSGREVWRTRLGDAITALSDARRGVLIARTAARRVVALDAREGRVVWAADEPPGVLTVRGVSAPLIFRNTAFVGFDDGHLAAFDLRSGEELNRVRIGAAPREQSGLDQIVDIDGRLAVDDGVLFVSAYRGATMAIDLRQWGVLWSAAGVGTGGGPTVTRRAVYVVESEGGVTALDRFSGEIEWHNELLEVKHLDYPVATERYVVVGDDEGYVYWLSKRNGDILKRDDVGDAVRALHGLPGDRVAVLTADGDFGVFQGRALKK